MTRRVIAVEPTRSAEAAWHEMTASHVHHLVVMEDGRIAGVVSESDLGGEHGESLRAGRQVRDLMTARVCVAAPETTVREAANLLRGNAIGCLPVVDGKRVLGIVTITDLLELIGKRWVPGPRGSRQRHVRRTSNLGRKAGAARD